MADPWDPRQYERYRSEREQPFHDLLALVRPRPGMRAVDLGCGTGTLTLVNVCGRKFRITNSSRIDLSTELTIAPERPALQLRIPAEATRDIVVAARDTARLLFGGREVASAATGGECH